MNALRSVKISHQTNRNGNNGNRRTTMGANTKKVCGVINHRRTQRATDVSCTNFRRVFTSENLTEDFGRLSETGRAFIQELSMPLLMPLGSPAAAKSRCSLRNGRLYTGRFPASAFNGVRGSVNHWGLIFRVRSPLNCRPNFSLYTLSILC